MAAAAGRRTWLPMVTRRRMTSAPAGIGQKRRERRLQRRTDDDGGGDCGGDGGASLLLRFLLVCELSRFFYLLEILP